jgi:hypothetical protein
MTIATSSAITNRHTGSPFLRSANAISTDMPAAQIVSAHSLGSCSSPR